MLVLTSPVSSATTVSQSSPLRLSGPGLGPIEDLYGELIMLNQTKNPRLGICGVPNYQKSDVDALDKRTIQTLTQKHRKYIVAGIILKCLFSEFKYKNIPLNQAYSDIKQTLIKHISSKTQYKSCKRFLYSQILEFLVSTPNRRNILTSQCTVAYFASYIQ